MRALPLNSTIALLSIAAFASAASARVTDALLPRIAVQFDVGLAAASSAITAFAVAYGVMQLLFGPLGDRFGKLRVIAVAAGGAALGTFACLAAPGFHMLLVARAAAGGFCACVIPLSMAWIGDVVPYEERQPVLARFLIGQILGVAAGAALGGFAAGTGDWRWPFAILGAWFALACIALAFAARRDHAPRAASSRFFHDVAGVLAAPWARVVVATVFAEGMLVFGALAFVPTHLHFARGMELSTGGLMVVAFGLGGFGFAVVVRPAVRRLGETGLAVGGTLLLAGGLALVALVPWRAFAPFGCLLAGFGFYMLHNTLQTNATQMAPQRRGAGMALFAACLYLGQSAGVALAGGAAQAWGTTPLIVGASMLLVPTGFAFAALRRRRTIAD
ncbi:MAG TPA: MFS transporter [Usitatibacter sp.]|nr:MFS transporter [Usitatibacter sp.]